MKIKLRVLQIRRDKMCIKVKVGKREGRALTSGTYTLVQNKPYYISPEKLAVIKLAQKGNESHKNQLPGCVRQLTQSSKY